MVHRGRLLGASCVHVLVTQMTVSPINDGWSDKCSQYPTVPIPLSILFDHAIVSGEFDETIVLSRGDIMIGIVGGVLSTLNSRTLLLYGSESLRKSA